jgi:heme-degrading monooxygenase HmoA
MNTILNVFVMAVALLAVPALAQQQAGQLLDRGLGQLNDARLNRTDTSYKAAEKTFTEILTSEDTHAQALVYRGEARIMRGVLALQTAPQTAATFFQEGMRDMDRAAALAPADLTVRVTRGLTYVEFPVYYNKRTVASEDLEAVVGHPDFGILPQALRDRIVNALERAKASGTLTTRPDRFARVAATTSPVIAVVSVTVERLRPSDRPAWLERIMAALYQSPGLLGAHTATSFDQPGMFLIFTWWDNKHALNDFYYSDVHQSWMRGRLSGAMTTYHEAVPSQVGIELFTSLPGGVTLGGGFVPKGAQPR